MKRNKMKAKGMRSGISPYKRSEKSPCAHCRAITAENRNRAKGAANAV